MQRMRMAGAHGASSSERGGQTVDGRRASSAGTARQPATSCAPVFVLTLLPTLGITPAAHLAQLIARASPVITILGEAAIGVLLLLPSRRLARYAVGLALLLHLGIALTPPPNNAVPFSLKCVVRLIITHPFGVSAALGEVRPLAACPPTLTLASSQNLPG